MPADHTVAARAPRVLSRRPWWPLAKRLLTLAFFVALIGLVANQARTVDWGAVLESLRGMPATTLVWAAALAAASFAIYATYDLIGRHQTGHTLPPWRVAGVGVISYAFNLNLGSLIGGVAFRYRLYSRLGLPTDTITQVLGLSLLTNWLGYFAVAGGVFAIAPLALPPDWKLGSDGLRWLGIALLAAAGLYVGLCAFATRREWTLRGHLVRLPSLRVALLQIGLSSLNWSLIGGVVWTLLQQRIDYPSVLGVLLVAAVAGVITHVPAGIGVLEAVFVALLGHRMPHGELLAALLAYRAIYYLAPLALAGALFLVLDFKGVGGKLPAAQGRGRDRLPSQARRKASTRAS